jgi:hypothetical protein
LQAKDSRYGKHLDRFVRDAYLEAPLSHAIRVSPVEGGGDWPQFRYVVGMRRGGHYARHRLRD